MRYKRPNIPYKDAGGAHNTRYHIGAKARKPLREAALDGDFNYIIDSINDLNRELQHGFAGVVPGSAYPKNKDKLLTTDGGNPPILSWVNINSVNIVDNAIRTHHLAQDSITSGKIVNLAIGTHKIDNQSITIDKIKTKYATEQQRSADIKRWAKGIGVAEPTANTIVVRDKDNTIKSNNIKTLDINTTNLTSDNIKLKEKGSSFDIKNIVAADSDKVFHSFPFDKFQSQLDAWLQKKLDDEFDKEHPVGSLNIVPYRDHETVNGIVVTWLKIESGRALVTSKDSKFDLQGKDNIVGSKGKTGHHTLTIDEMPKHDHNLKYGEQRFSDFSVSGEYGHTTSYRSRIHSTEDAGGSQPHSHPLDVKRLEIPIYKRVS